MTEFNGMPPMFPMFTPPEPQRPNSGFGGTLGILMCIAAVAGALILVGNATDKAQEINGESPHDPIERVGEVLVPDAEPQQ